MKDLKKMIVKRVLVVGTHSMKLQPSMSSFAQWLTEALNDTSEVKICHAPPLFLNKFSRNWSISKYLYYIDQFLVFPFVLFFVQFRYAAVLVADHANAPSAIFVRRHRLSVMIHDTIAMRRARGGLLPEFPKAGIFGRILQKITFFSINRSKMLMVNPGPVKEELLAMGAQPKICMVGCPIDFSKFSTEASKPDLDPGISRFVLYVGNDIPRKRQKTLVRAWNKIHSDTFNVNLVLAGSSSAETQILAASEAPKMCQFMKNVRDDELKWLYQNCEAFISASEHEGFCLPAIEAIFFNKKVLVSSGTSFYTDLFGECASSILDFSSIDLSTVEDALNTPISDGFVTERQALLETYSQASFRTRVISAVREVTG